MATGIAYTVPTIPTDKKLYKRLQPYLLIVDLCHFVVNFTVLYVYSGAYFTGKLLSHSRIFVLLLSLLFAAFSIPTTSGL